ncbi:AraC family transcriptional regulator [Streptomyces sp. NPDC029044]|uniref:AraC family transcriptional regulator n=1 Tax=Streptomyces sp. NPDC029044 TaxID=3157198 RepID=UPI00340D279C
MRRERAVEQAVRIIRERYAEPLGLDELARAVLVSKFHLLRIFTEITGVTPGRFLSAVRISEAKRLLQQSDLAVACISSMVGYSSTGSFTSRFTDSVGIPPTRYRQLSRGQAEFTARPRVDDDGARPERSRLGGVTRARAVPLSPIYIGSFEGPILQGRPSSWTSTRRPGPFVLEQVPYGTCYLHATMLAVREHPLETVLLTATFGPVQIGPYAGVEAELVLRPRAWWHPPVLFAVPGLEILTGRTHPGFKRIPSGFK